MTALSKPAVLKTQFSKALHGYYQLGEGNESNGGPIEGTIYPPDIKQDDVVLGQRIDKLSTFLSKKDGITYRPSPELGEGRLVDRAQVAAESSGWVAESAKTALKVATDLIQDPGIKAMVLKGLETADPKFWTATSSSSGMFHPADEINKGGLVLHTARVVAMGEHLGEFFELDTRERDILRAGLILHDSVKGGTPWDKYANDHGELAGAMIRSLDTEDTGAQEMAAQIADNHMAIWRQGAKGSENEGPNPAVPNNKMDMIASLADYLAARDDIYVDAPGVSKDVEPTLTVASRLAPKKYSGTPKTGDGDKEHKKGFPPGVSVTFDKNTIKIEAMGKSYSGKISAPELNDSLVQFGEMTPDFEPTRDKRNEMEGMRVEADFWLLTGARGGKLMLSRGSEEKGTLQRVEYMIRPPEEELRKEKVRNIALQLAGVTVDVEADIEAEVAALESEFREQASGK